MVLSRIGMTGASGMLGRHLLAELDRRDIHCISTSRSRPLKQTFKGSWFQWDLSEWRSIEELSCDFKGIDALVHLGAAIPSSGSALTRQQILDTNVRASLCLGEVSLQLGIPLLYISSSTVYAEPDRSGIREEDAKLQDGRGSLYGLTKLMGEEILLHLKGQGLRLCILRPSSLYGYGLPDDKLIPKFLLKAARGEVINLDPPFDDKVDLIHATDLAEAILLALEHDVQGVYNVASGVHSSILEIAQGCVQAAQAGKVMICETAPSRAATVRFGLDFNAARAAFKYKPRITLLEGLTKTFSDMKTSQAETFGCGT
jgi:UDP-glucose 4-epimerase